MQVLTATAILPKPSRASSLLRSVLGPAEIQGAAQELAQVRACYLSHCYEDLMAHLFAGHRGCTGSNRFEPRRYSPCETFDIDIGRVLNNLIGNDLDHRLVPMAFY